MAEVESEAAEELQEKTQYKNKALKWMETTRVYKINAQEIAKDMPDMPSVYVGLVTS